MTQVLNASEIKSQRKRQRRSGSLVDILRQLKPGKGVTFPENTNLESVRVTATRMKNRGELPAETHVYELANGRVGAVVDKKPLRKAS